MHRDLEIAHAVADLLREGGAMELDDEGLAAYLQSLLVTARRLCSASIDLEFEGAAASSRPTSGPEEVRMDVDLPRVERITLVLWSSTGVVERDLDVVRLLVDTAVEAMAHRDAHRKGERLVADLRTALQSRIAIEQAKGLLAGRHDTDLDQAFEWLRTHARASQSRVREVAAEVVAGRVDPAR